ncbi:NAD kinase 2, chloroplastic-like isoform X2 [Andrographis paniculata]|uniref:NAD kinase 2, chloroplastic-like isoform X2 n=1 Tax=Andrographis paniculata TaxID=175694 RepID=UPI0021E847AA|nr:NAD kinase 2, chloroplastic-like isoform X2 [Andrographis paniculata]
MVGGMATSPSYYFSNSCNNCRRRYYASRPAGAASFCRRRSCVKISGAEFDFLFQKWKKKGWLEVGCRRSGIAVAQLSSSLSMDIGLDSQKADSFHLPWVGPLPGDIAEVEAYCRIFRAAEQFHNALMAALHYPVTGKSGVSNGMSSEGKRLLEEKIVYVLGCMVCLLDKGREDVLSGRSSIMNSFQDLNATTITNDNLPPLATFQSEMKSYCETLHVALESSLTPGDEQSLNVWRKLQRLKNVCCDSGFPRGDDHPCHTLFANWGPILLSSSRGEGAHSENMEIAFWKGGQVTEEGLKWLLEKGFRTIVDLRSEFVKDIFYETAVHEAVSSGKIELIKLPIEAGDVPSLEQIAQFAAIVADSSKKPIYVHSKEGKRRTYSMIFRWRQYVDQIAATGKQASATDLRAHDVQEGEDSGFTNKPFRCSAGPSKNRDPPSTTYQSQNTEGAENTKASNEEGGVKSTIDLWEDVKPLESQLPPSDVLSRKEMSRFFTNKSFSPQTFFGYGQKRLDMSSAEENGSLSNKEAHSGLGPSEEKIINKLVDGNVKSSSRGQIKAVTNCSYPDPSVLFSPVPRIDKASGGALETRLKNSSTDTRNDPKESAISVMVTGQSESDAESYLSSDDESLEMMEGDMCASKTGVVRVQSRKKAEMFLVRTDGFSCTRAKVRESSLAFSHPSTQQQLLLWKTTPRTVLLLKKLGEEVMEEAKQVASFLYFHEKMNVLVEPEVHDVFSRISGFGFVQTFYTQDTSDLHQRVDLVACLGGDGVILHASKLFRGAVPPVVSFNLGSLGFLTSHTFDDYRKDLRQVIHGNYTIDGIYVTLRMRLHCEIFRNGKAVPGKIFSVLNEVVVDRGSNPYLSKIECYDHDRLITKVQGDGVIIATPTGSTAYSTAAGGSMVHPNVPCMLFTPICPHSLSFRPVILPDSARLELKIPENARSNAWVSFDGKRRQQLSRGDSVRISMSQHPLPTVNKSDQTGDWFRSLIRCLNWNERLDQKAL